MREYARMNKESYLTLPTFEQLILGRGIPVNVVNIIGLYNNNGLRIYDGRAMFMSVEGVNNTDFIYE